MLKTQCNAMKRNKRNEISNMRLCESATVIPTPAHKEYLEEKLNIRVGGNRVTEAQSRKTTISPPDLATILKHCRCIDCRNFHCMAGEYYCTKHVGGTKVVWATGKRICEPAPDAWHYCVFYHGPQISRDVWVWPKGDHVGPCAKDAEPASQPLRRQQLPATRANVVQKRKIKTYGNFR